MSKILGFAPDADPTLAGVIVDCEMMLPSEIGMRTAPAADDVGMAPLASDARGAFVGTNLLGAKRLIVGTSTALFQASSSSWADVSGAAYALGADDRWSLAQFGDAMLAATPASPIQRSVGGNFEEIPDAPKARILVAAKGFVVAFGTNDATYGDSPDRWWCCAWMNEADWTPNVATQCTTGRVVESGGQFTAAARFGDDIVAYKRGAMWLARYVGAPAVWDFIPIASDIGCVGQEAVCDTGTGHVFVGIDDIYLFDGNRPHSIAAGVCRDWYVATRDPKNVSKTRILWDRKNSLAWIFFASVNGGGDVDSGLVFHVKTGRWGRANFEVEAVLAYSSPASTYDGGSPLITTYNASPQAQYDSPFWVEDQETIAIVDSTHTLKTLSGTTNISSFTTGDYGDDAASSMCDSFKIRYRTSPTSASATGYTKDDLGTTVISASAAARNDASFDMRQTGRWHRFRVDQVGSAEAMEILPRLKAVGGR